MNKSLKRISLLFVIFVLAGILSVQLFAAESSEDHTTGALQSKNGASTTVARIDNDEYATLEAALTAAVDGNYIELLADINNFAGVTIEKNIQIDFGTYTVTGAADVVAFKIKNATVIFCGTTGGINGGAGGDNVAVQVTTGGTLCINGGVYTVGADANGLGNSTIYITDNGYVEINDGTFSTAAPWNGFHYVLNLNNSATGTFSVVGGTFVNYDPFKGDDNKGGNFLYYGHGVSNTDGGYVVTEAAAQLVGADGVSKQAYETLAQALGAAQSGETVVMLCHLENTDYDQVVNLPLKQGVTLDGGDENYIISGNVALHVNTAGGVTIKNVRFKDIHNSANTLSPIYASELAGSLTIEGCSFENWDWDAIQITPKSTATITIVDNYFSHTLDTAAKRVIHIQSKVTENQFTTVITNNEFAETNLQSCQFEVYYIGEGASYTFSGNTGIKTACILTPTNANISHVVAGNAKAMVGDVYDKVFYETLEQALDAAQSGKIVTMLADLANTDYDTVKILPLKPGVTFDGNGHTISGNVYVRAEKADGVTIRNVHFKDIHSNDVMNQRLSPISVVDLAGSLTIEDCTFTNWDWDAIQVFSPKSTAIIKINGNTFAHTLSTPAKHVIWIESEETENQFETVITNNTFAVTNLESFQLDVCFIGDGASYTFSGNTGIKSARILDANWNCISHIIAGDAEAMIGNDDGGIFCATLEEAIAAASRNIGVTLLKDVEADIVVPQNTILSLNLFGHKLTNVKDHTIINHGVLFIFDSVGSGVVDNITHGKAAFVNSGTAIAKGVKFTRSLESSSNSYYVILNHEGNLTLEGASVINTSTFSTAVENKTDNDDKPAKLTIADGTTISNNFTAVKNGYVSILKIEGGTITANNGNKAVQTYGTASIDKTVIINGDVEATDWTANDTYFPVLTIAGGTINGNVRANALKHGGQVGTDAKIIITGGTINGKVSKTYQNTTIVEQPCNYANAEITISGGTFNQKIHAEFCAEGYGCVQDGDVYKVGPHTHSYDNDQDAICNTCGYQRYALTDAQLSLGFDLSFKLYARGITAEHASEFTLHVTRNGETIVLNPTRNDKDNSYYFLYTGITPQCMGDEFSAELYMGNAKVATLESYSVKQYLNTIANGNYSAQAQQLAQDMLAYGAAAQAYRNYNAESPVTTEQIRNVTLPTNGMSLSNSPQEGAPQFISANLLFDNVNRLCFYFAASDITNVTATINGKDATIANWGNSKYVIETNGIYASEYGTQFEVKLFENGDLKSTLSYSVYDYIAGATDLEDDSWQNLVKALYAYGESAKAYADSRQGN